VAQLIGVSTLLLAVLSAQQPSRPLFRTTTAKSLDAFAACFTKAQDERAQSWAFMPAGRGGTFTNSGANGSGAAYWLQVRTSGAREHIRLFADRANDRPASVVEAVEQCR
jgi:hypothetical protein